MTIVEFLTARLDEEERAARAATRGPWRASETMVWVGDTDETVAAYSDYYMDDAYDGPEMSGLNKADALHIALHDPARVLREVEAKRKMLDLTVGQTARWGDLGSEANSMADDVVKAMASVYSDHPDYAAIE